MNLKSRRLQGVRPSAASRGFTLIELLVAFGVGLLLLGLLVTLFASNSRNQNELERTLRRVENARFAIDALREDILHAGYFSDANPLSQPVAPSWQTLADPSCTVFAGIDSTVMGWNTAVTPMTMPVAVQGIPAATNIACLGSRRANTEAVALRRAETGDAITRAAIVADNLYIQVSRCPNDLRRVAVASLAGVAALSLRLPDCAAQNDAVRRLVQRTYFISDCNDCAANDGIPTLKRIESINGVLRTTSVAEGVEDFQLEYGEDTNVAPDGRPDVFVKAGAVTNWANVVAVRIHLLIRGTERSPGYADTRTYQLGPGVQLVAPADGFKRTVFTDTVRLVNVGGRWE